MAYEQRGTSVGQEVAAADLSAKQFYLVAMSSTGWNVAGAGTYPDGVLQNKPASGAQCDVMVDGISKVVASAAIAKGARVSSTAAGKAVTASTNDYTIGVALQAASADGDIISILIVHQGKAV